VADIESQADDPRPVREGLPSTYRMRADRHYVDLLASRVPAGRERTVPVASLDSPGIIDMPGLAPLIESVKLHGVLQPLIVHERDGRMHVIAGQRRLAAATAAGLRDVPCIVHDVDEAEADALRAASNVREAALHAPPQADARTHAVAAPPVATAAGPAPIAVSDPAGRSGDDLARSLGTASSLADLLTGPMSDLSRGVVGNLLRAELWRATTLLQAARAVRGELPVTRAAVPIAALVDKVVQGFGPERRMRHVEFVPHIDLPANHIVIADEGLLAAALTGAIVATLALVEGLQAGRITVVAGLNASRQLTLVASQEHVLPPQTWAERAFDLEWRERPGGTPVSISMAAVLRAARVHGGDATATISPRGSRIGLTIPAGA
jgi:hypothetical protein